MSVRVITQPCIVCHQTSELIVTDEQAAGLEHGDLVQSIFPEMSDDERELFVTGTHPACWEAIFADEPED